MSSLAPEAFASVEGSQRRFTNHGPPSKDVARLSLELRRRTSYSPQLQALPYDFVKRSNTTRLVRSLESHAEKKALADLLNSDAKELEISINFRMCVDCHAFMKGASRLLGRAVLVREPKLLHSFADGVCSCNDRWRWEESARGPRSSNAGSNGSAAPRAGWNYAAWCSGVPDEEV